MKLKILAGLVTALIYGNAAMAQDEVEEKDTTQGQESPDNFGGSGLDDTAQDDLIILDQEDVAPVPDTGVQEEGVGGAGFEDQEAIGGSGQQAPLPAQPKAGIPIQGQGGMTLYCTPVQAPATGGSGEVPSDEQSALPPGDVQVGDVDTTLPSEDAFAPSEGAYGGSGYEMVKEEKQDMRGVSVVVGGGLEGYTGGLASEINPGATANVTAGFRPTNVFGLELGYSGAVNQLDVDVPGDGPDVVRNGAVANVTLGVTATPVQPYVLGGFGMNWYNVRNGAALGFDDDTSSRIPLGLGLRTQFGAFTADARVNYNVLLSDDFAPARVDNGEFTTGSYQGTINLGGTF